MKTRVFTGLLGLVSLLFMAVPANVMAFGLGIVESLGAGSLKEDAHSINSTNYDLTKFSLGLVLDPRLGQDRVFNHRFEVSFQKMKATANTVSNNSKYDMRGLAIQNTFGFAVMQDQTTRVWIGPEVKVEFVEGGETSNGAKYYENILGLGFGPVAGVNYRLDDTVFLVLKAGYMQQYGITFFSEWKEQYGFLSLGVIFDLGESKKVRREGSLVSEQVIRSF